VASLRGEDEVNQWVEESRCKNCPLHDSLVRLFERQESFLFDSIPFPSGQNAVEVEELERSSVGIHIKMFETFMT